MGTPPIAILSQGDETWCMQTGGERELGATIVEAVAEAEGVDPGEISDPLYEVVDPDALAALFTGGSGRVIFEYGGYIVTVDSEATVDVERVGR